MDKKTIQILFYDEEQGWITGSVELDAEEEEAALESSDEPRRNAPKEND